MYRARLNERFGYKRIPTSFASFRVVIVLVREGEGTIKNFNGGVCRGG